MSAVRRSSRLASKVIDIPVVDKVTKPKKSAKKVAKKEIKEDDDYVESKPSDLLEIGDEIPDIVLKNEDDKDISLKELTTANRIVAIFAYPKASTPGCTKQACGYSANYASLHDKAKIYGLSSDSPKAQKSFIVKQSLKLDGLLSDPEKKLIGPLGAKKSPSGIKRSHWIFVDGKLKVSRIQISPQVSIEDGKKEIEEIFASLK